MIKIDSHEDSTVEKAFIKHNIPYVINTLVIGDFNCDEKPQVTIEHKRISDFVSSFRLGHLQKQLMDAEHNYKYSYLIINGSWKDFAVSGYSHLTTEQKIGMLVSIATRFNVRIVSVDNDSQLALAVKAIFEKADDGKQITIRDTELLRNTLNSDDIKLMLVTCFDGIGQKRAQKYLKDENIDRILNELIAKVQGAKMSSSHEKSGNI